MGAAPKPRPKYYDLNLAHLPPAGLVSIFHRISGAVLFLFIPVFLAALQASLASEEEFARLRAILAEPAVKAIALGIVWLYAHHFYAGLRYLLLDVHVGTSKESAGTSAKAVFALGIVTTLAIGAFLW